MSVCCQEGPGYRTPAEAIKGPKEQLLYTVLVYAGTESTKPDCLATIDCDPASSTYSQVLHKLEMPYVGDELHHFGWNTCSSCCGDATKVRRYLIVPGFKSSRIYIIDTLDNPRAPRINKIIEPSEIVDQWGLTSPHTVHCLANGDVLISFLGLKDGQPPGGFLLLDENFNIKGKWAEDESKKLTYSYDFWYQPYHNVMISSTWACPNIFKKGFNPAEVKENYGREIFFWDWKEGKINKKIDLGDDGLIPLELRFHHDPKSPHGFVGAALSSSIFHWWKEENNGSSEWKLEKVIQVDPVELAGWPMPVPGLITDILISMDDRFLYFSDWLHGDIRQYDITEPSKPKLVGQVWCGGLIGGEKTELVKGNKLNGGPQMLQLSLDGKRLYVTNSLFSSWDDQFYPDIRKYGSQMIKVDVDNEKGGMKIDQSFYLMFADGPYRAHETRYPGGDCSSDIFIAQ